MEIMIESKGENILSEKYIPSGRVVGVTLNQITFQKFRLLNSPGKIREELKIDIRHLEPFLNNILKFGADSIGASPPRRKA